MEHKDKKCAECGKMFVSIYVKSKYCSKRFNGWHIDHIKPTNKFNLLIKEEQCKCFNYTNLQPLWAEDNWLKGGN